MTARHPLTRVAAHLNEIEGDVHEAEAALLRLSLQHQLENRDAELAKEMTCVDAIGETASVHCGCSITVTERFWSYWQRRHSFQGHLTQCEAHEEMTYELAGHLSDEPAEEGDFTCQFENWSRR